MSSKLQSKSRTIPSNNSLFDAMLEKLSVQCVDGQSVVKRLEERRPQKMSKTCLTCDKTPLELGLLQLKSCSACSIKPLYCSVATVAFQRSDWQLHKPLCKESQMCNEIDQQKKVAVNLGKLVKHQRTKQADAMFVVLVVVAEIIVILYPHFNN